MHGRAADKMVEGMSESLVYVVVLAWNHKQDTIECLESFRSTDYQNFHLIVVDNGSTDGTPELIQRVFPDVEVLRSPTNLGIAGGYNLGLEKALERNAEYVLVTNNDISVDKSLIRNLATALDNSRHAGMGMPKIFNYYGDQTRLWCTGARWRRFPPGVKMMGVNARDSSRFASRMWLEYAPSCSLMIRCEVLQRIGLFDTGYYFYNDDWDFSARLRQAGYGILFVPEARLWHKVSVSTQRSDKPAKWWYAMGRSTVRFYLRHSSPLVLAQYSVWFLIRETVKLRFARIIPFLRGIRHELRLYRSDPEAMKARGLEPR